MYKVYDELITELRDAFKAEMANGIKCLEGEDAEKLSDMIKDLEEAKKNCYESCYYRMLCKIMAEEEKEDYNEDEYDELMGYNPNRNIKGQYSTRAGRTRGMRGYHPGYPGIDSMGRIHDPNRDWEREMMEREMKMGYTGESRGNRSGNSGNRIGRGGNMGYDDPNGYVDETVDALNDMYDQADPETQKRMREGLMNLLKEKR